MQQIPALSLQTIRRRRCDSERAYQAAVRRTPTLIADHLRRPTAHNHFRRRGPSRPGAIVNSSRRLHAVRSTTEVPQVTTVRVRIRARGRGGISRPSRRVTRWTLRIRGAEAEQVAALSSVQRRLTWLATLSLRVHSMTATRRHPVLVIVMHSPSSNRGVS